MIPVFLHIGTRKSGTSYLQAALRDSVPELAAQGVDLTFKTRKGHVTRQLRPLQHFAATGDDGELRDHLDWLVRHIRSRPEHRHLITLEDLAELPAPAAERLVGALSEFDLHLVVTARHWGHSIPSEWQQCIKERDTVSYPDFITAIRDGKQEADIFLARQDLPAILDRWGSSLPRENVHVIAVPPSSRTEGTLVELFSSLIEVDPSSLKLPSSSVNQSIMLPQAEMLRRVNVALGDRLPELEVDYKHGVRVWLTRGSLMRHATTSIRLPSEFGDWCIAEAERQYQGVVELGVDVIGRPEDLRPGSDLATGPATVGEDEVASTAVTALADLATQRWRELSRHQQQVARLEAEIADLRMTTSAEPAAGGWRGRLSKARRVLGGRRGGDS